MWWKEKRPRFTFDISGDFHLGHPNPPDRNPTEKELRTSLQSALDRKVDGYIVVGDGVHDNSIKDAHRLAALYKEYTSKGLRMFVMKGNHDEIPEIGAILAQDGGVELLDGQVVKMRKGLRTVALIGATSEFGPDHTNWWKAEKEEDRNRARQRVRQEARKYEAFLQQALRRTRARDIIVVTHRGIIPETVGSKAQSREKGSELSPQIETYAKVIRQESRTPILRRKRRIHFVHGHDHGDYPWEGGLTGWIGHVPVYNDAAPLRKRIGLPTIARTMQL